VLNTRIHPTAVVGPGVELGSGVTVGPLAVLLGPLVIGDRSWIGPSVSLGGPPEIRGVDHGAAWDGEQVGTGVRIGADVVLREGTTVHQGWYDRTLIGNGCFLMNKVYVAHDCHLGDGATLASSATLGGHVHVGTGANLGMNATVHQRRSVGAGAMVGMGAVVTRSIPPWAMAFGSPCRVRGVNTVGMTRAGLEPSAIEWLGRRYRDGEAVDPERAPSSVRPQLQEWEDSASLRER
jgi:UDP-N-acetylglucosamine acyltransferase